MNTNSYLDWTEEREASETIRYNHTLADSPIGRFSIEWRDWKKYDEKAIYLDGCYIDSASTLEGAKELVDKYLLSKAEQICELFRLHEERSYTSKYQWQPIETAPESGPFLVHGGMFRSELYADSKTREAVIVSGRAPYTMFHNKGDILFYVAGENYPEEWVVNPTHWLPMPEAPQGE